MRMDSWLPWYYIVFILFAGSVSCIDVSDICTRCSCHYLDSAHITETVCGSHQSVLDVNCTVKPNVRQNANQFLNNLSTADSASLAVWLSFEAANVTAIQRYPQFEQFTVTKLSLDYNSITSVPQKAFSRFKKLAILTLSHNKISSVSSESLIGMHNLKFIDLSYNGLKSFDFMLILDAINIESLDLSHNALAAIVPPEEATGLSTLQHLDLSLNSLSLPPVNAFASFPNLVKLNVSHNNISYLEADLFSFQSKLKILDLSGNVLKQIDLISMSKLTSLERLYLNHNFLSEVGFVRPIKTLQILDLSHNDFDSTENETVNANINRLIIQHNNLSDLNDVLQAFPNLKSLDASWNPCTQFPELVRARLEELILDGALLTSWPAQTPGDGVITHLSLSHIAGLKKLGPHAFSGILKTNETANAGTKKCASLEIRHTSLSDIDEDAFSNLDLCKLDLSNNKLRWLPEKLLDWATMVGVDLQGNPWHCECSLQWMVDSLIPTVYKNDQSLLEELRCASPDDVQGKRLVHWYNHSAALCGNSKQDVMLTNKFNSDSSIVEKITMASSPIMIAVFVFCGVCTIFLVILAFALQRSAVRSRRTRKNRRFN